MDDAQIGSFENSRNEDDCFYLFLLLSVTNSSVNNSNGHQIAIMSSELKSTSINSIFISIMTEVTMPIEAQCHLDYTSAGD